MAWTDVTFAAGSVLTATKMTQLDENFDALAAQNAGAPLVTFPNSPTTALMATGASSFETVEVNSNLSVFGGLRWPHFALRYDAGNPPTVIRQTNVSCLERLAAGDYAAHISPAFADSSYYLLSMNGQNAGSARDIHYNADSSTLSRVRMFVKTPGGTNTDLGVGFMIVGFGD